MTEIVIRPIIAFIHCIFDLFMNKINNVIKRFRSSKLIKDSVWAVFGNGLGNAFLLAAGILIARLLGKDLYGEYGVVKTTMFHIAGFATFGLGYTSTKFIAQYISENTSKIKAIARASLTISLVSSLLLCSLLCLFAKELAIYINNPQLVTPFRFLGIIVVCRAISTTSSGIISGFKDFKHQGKNNIVSGLLMLVLAPILTYFWGLNGSLLSLLISQLFLSILNLLLLRSLLNGYTDSEESFIKPLLVFSIPVAMQELTYTLSHWAGPLLVAKYASLGEVGLYTAAGQWNVIVRFIPGLLSSVVLSYLSSATKHQEHNKMMYRVLGINFVCTLVPFLLVLAFSGLIVKMYGPSFDGLQVVINTLVFSTIFYVVARVFQNEFISRGRNWLLFGIRAGMDIISLSAIYLVLKYTGGEKAAINYAIIDVSVNVLFLATLAFFYYLDSKKSAKTMSNVDPIS